MIFQLLFKRFSVIKVEKNNEKQFKNIKNINKNALDLTQGA